MRRFVLAAVMTGAAWGAQAADLADLPILRGSYTDGPTSSVNWAGFYLGGQGGYGSADGNFQGSTRNIASKLLADTLIESAMQVSQWDLGLGKTSARNSGFGAFAGYNWQWDEAVLGVEASYLHGTFGGTTSASEERVTTAALSDTFFHDVKATSSAAISISDMATFRGRTGYAFGCFLPYAFGGFALGNADITRSFLVEDRRGVTASGPFSPPAILSATEGVHNHLIYGYTMGLGMDINLIGGLFMRAEWEYVRFTATVDTTINTVRAGLGYKF